VKGPKPCSSGYISTTHQSFLYCTLSPAIHFNGSNGTAYTRHSKVQNTTKEGKRTAVRVLRGGVEIDELTVYCRRRGEAVEKEKGGENRERIIGKGKKTIGKAVAIDN
jgi:hypothetical protein